MQDQPSALRNGPHLPRTVYLLMVAVMAAGAGFSFGRAEAPSSGGAMNKVVGLLSTSITISGETIAYPTGAPAKVTAAVVTLRPGEETGWHTHPVPAFGYILEGELSVQYASGDSRLYKSGEAVLEAMSVAHNGRNTGAVPMRILAVFMGADGVSNSMPAAPEGR